jgi:hypothetical protein
MLRNAMGERFAFHANVTSSSLVWSTFRWLGEFGRPCRLVTPKIAGSNPALPAYRLLAQMVEQFAHNEKGKGSSPLEPTQSAGGAMVAQSPDTRKVEGSSPSLPTLYLLSSSAER